MSGYISSEGYISSYPRLTYDPYNEGVSSEICAFMQPIKTENDYYDTVDHYCSLEPYVDKIYWKIDGTSDYEYPNNVVWERD